VNASRALTVSVIVPVFNGADYLAEALANIAAQDRPPDEVVVIDDGSTDASAEIARSAPGVRVVSQANQGHGGARNAGIAATSGDVIAFLDHDDRWTLDKLRVQVGHLEDHPEIGVVLARQRMLLEAGFERPAWMAKRALDEPEAAPIPSALVARRAVFDGVGGFDPTFRMACDTDWLFRARDAGVSIAWVPDVLVLRRVHRGNMSNATAAGKQEFLRVLHGSVRRKARPRETSPRVSVVIPAFNAERFLGAAIESALAQSPAPLEVLVVDDGSTDGTAAVARSHDVRYAHQENAGVAAAANLGASLAHGDFLAFVDADDVWLPGKLARQLARLEAEPGLEAVFGRVREVDLRAPSGAPAREEAFVARLTMLIRRDAFGRVGPFDPRFRIGEFVEWFGRAEEKGLRHATLPDVVAERRIHGANMGIVDRARRGEYLLALKSVLDRRRRVS